MKLYDMPSALRQRDTQGILQECTNGRWRNHKIFKEALAAKALGVVFNCGCMPCWEERGISQTNGYTDGIGRPACRVVRTVREYGLEVPV